MGFRKHWQLALALALSATACSGADSSDGDDSDRAESERESATSVGEVSVGSTRVEFLESPTGGIGIASLGPRDAQNPLHDFDPRRESYSSLYQRLSGTPAPKALLDAEAREQALPNQGEELSANSEDDTMAPVPAAVFDKQLSNEEFTEQWCKNYPICWTGVMGFARVTRKSSWVNGYVAPISGSLVMSVREGDVFGNWSQFRSWTVHQDQLLRFTGPRPLVSKNVKCEVKQADNTLYHFTMTW